MASTMPVVNMEAVREKLSNEDYDVAMRIVKKDNSVRASSPLRDRNHVSEAEGVAHMAWRHVVFMVSRNPQHQCMPVCDNLYLPDIPEYHGWDTPEDVKQRNWAYRKELEKRAEHIADVVVNAIDPRQWAGVQRWGQAFGLLG